jgi:hypothetical protein
MQHSFDRESAELGPEHEVRHEPEIHEQWQESVVLCWWDSNNRIGGYHRIGHQPYRSSGPLAHLSNNVFTPEWVYKRCEILPLRSEDQFRTGFGCGDGTCKFDFTDHAIWTFQQKEIRGELHVEDFHVPVDIYPKRGQLAEQITAGHLEVGGRITGLLDIDGRPMEVDGLCFRDHGWGKRHWDAFVAHRWIAGTFGPDLTLLALSVVGTDDHEISFGCVIRDTELVRADTVDILTYMEQDGLTHRGGRVHMKLNNGEVLDIDCVPLQKGVVSWFADCMSTVDTMCRMTYKDRVGICDFEISTNPGRGRHRALAGKNAFTVDGVHRL